MNGFENYSAIGRIDEIREPHINPNSGITKRGITITAGTGKSMNLEFYHWKVKQLENLKRGDQVHVIFRIKGATLKNGNRVNNLIAEKIILL